MSHTKPAPLSEMANAIAKSKRLLLQTIAHSRRQERSTQRERLSSIRPADRARHLAPNEDEWEKSKKLLRQMVDEINNHAPQTGVSGGMSCWRDYQFEAITILLQSSAEICPVKFYKMSEGRIRVACYDEMDEVFQDGLKVEFCARSLNAHYAQCLLHLSC